MATPEAATVQVRGKFAKIRCPYCRGIHEHKPIAAPFLPGSTHHRAPGCGLIRTGAERLTGYTFTIPTN